MGLITVGDVVSIGKGYGTYLAMLVTIIGIVVKYTVDPVLGDQMILWGGGVGSVTTMRAVALGPGTK